MVIVITGPIASGKSTIARELARQLELAGTGTAIIDLDVVHDRLANRPSSSQATWALARQAAATLANGHLARGAAVVIADGSFNWPSDRAAFVRHLDPGVDPHFVTLRVSFDEALRRARGDASRGRSRDPSFLGPYFEALAEAMAAIPASDTVIDTEQMSPTGAAAAIAGVLSPGIPPRGQDAD